MTRSSRAFRLYTLIALGWSLAVIAWGAYVRATGSGAGCGDHWPNCNGEIVPRSPSMKTIIEYTHRATSGLALISVVVLALWAFKSHKKGHAVRSAALWSLILMITEALLGALLVKLELVANNATANRAVAMSIHLVNTFLLIAAFALCAWRAWTGDRRISLTPFNSTAALAVGTLVSIVVLGVTGAVAALGDTLSQQSVVSAFVDLLIELRIIHPFSALAVTVLVLALGFRTLQVNRVLGLSLMAAVVLQLVVGLINVILMVPISVQLIHLLMADTVWLLSVTAAAALLSVPNEVTPAAGASLADGAATA